MDSSYYVYALVDPRTNLPFYIGKGKNNRYKSHFTITKRNKEENPRKFNFILSLKKEGFEPKVKILVENIYDENLAYFIEEDFIKKYGRKDYDENGILLNISESSRPPNHKGKTYKEIYGERWKEEIEKRRKTQLQRGGFGPKKHSEKTKKLLSEKNRGYNNANFVGIKEEDLLKIGQDFVKFFNGTISDKKWKVYCKINNISPNLRKSFRFNGRDIFEIFVEKFAAKIDNSLNDLGWFLHIPTGKSKRMFLWEFELLENKNEYERTRPVSHLKKAHFARKNRKQQKQHYNFKYF